MRMAPALIAFLGCLVCLSPSWAASLTEHELALREHYQRGLDQVEVDRRALQGRLHLQEKECLSRFVSAPCIERLRVESERENRVLDLARESLSESIRRLEAQARTRARAQRAEELSAR